MTVADGGDFTEFVSVNQLPMEGAADFRIGEYVVRFERDDDVWRVTLPADPNYVGVLRNPNPHWNEAEYEFYLAGAPYVHTSANTFTIAEFRRVFFGTE